MILPTIINSWERYYIKQYNSKNPNLGYNITAGGESNQLDANPRATLTLEEVIQIREIYAMCELRCKECWSIFKEKISYSAFQKIWEGTTWVSVMPEIYAEENIRVHINQKSNPGSMNGNALYTDEEVMEIRKFYVTNSLQKTYEKFGSKSKSKSGFRNLIDKSYKYLPIYSKIKKQWTLNDEIVDINNYNPVSTIPEAGE